MKNISKYLIIGVSLIILSCEQDVIDLQEPDLPERCSSCPEGATSGNASFDKFVTLYPRLALTVG